MNFETTWIFRKLIFLGKFRPPYKSLCSRLPPRIRSQIMFNEFCQGPSWKKSGKRTEENKTNLVDPLTLIPRHFLNLSPSCYGTLSLLYPPPPPHAQERLYIQFSFTKETHQSHWGLIWPLEVKKGLNWDRSKCWLGRAGSALTCEQPAVRPLSPSDSSCSFPDRTLCFLTPACVTK